MLQQLSHRFNIVEQLGQGDTVSLPNPKKGHGHSCPDGSIGSRGVAGGATPFAPRGACASFLAQLPPGIFIPPVLSCHFERISTLATGTLTNGDAAVDFSLPGQTIAAIRYEFNGQAP